MLFRLMLFATMSGSVLLAQIPLSERQALIDIYESHRIPSYLGSWATEGEFNPHGTESSWSGVTLDESQSHVIGLKLIGFDGHQLPSSISALTQLNSFEITGYNAIIGLPDTLADLTELERFSLKNAAAPIPDVVFDLTHLKDLNFEAILGLEALPSRWVSLVNLQNLNVTRCDLTTFDWNLLELLPNLSHLDLSYNQIQTDVGALNEWISQLILLNLSSNNLTGTLFEDWSQLKNLEWLSLSQNQIEGTIPEGIGGANHLRVLFLDSNQFQGDLPQSLLQVSNLGSLDLSNNQLSGDPSFLGAMVGLYDLNLSNNSFNGEILHAMGKMPVLNRLDLRSNQFSGEFPEDPTSFPYMTKCQLAFNHFSGAIPDYLCERDPLLVLDISYNQFSAMPDCLLDYNTRLDLLFGHNAFGPELCDQLRANPFYDWYAHGYIQNDTILPCHTDVLSVAPWIPEEIVQWDNSITGINPTWDLKDFSVVGSEETKFDPTGQNRSYGLWDRLNYRSFSRYENISRSDYGMSLYFFSPSLTNLVQIETAYKNAIGVLDEATSFAISEENLSNQVLLPHFLGAVPAAFTVTSPYGQGQNEITCQIIGSQGLILERSFTLNGYNPLAVLIDDLFPPLELSEHYMVRLTQPDGQKLAAMAYQFIPGRGISMSTGLPAESLSQEWALPWVPMDSGLQTFISIANPSSKNEMVELHAVDQKGTTRNRAINIAANSVQSLDVQTFFGILDDFSIHTKSQSSNSHLMVHLFCVDVEQGQLAQCNGVSLDAISRVQHLGYLESQEDPMLAIFAPDPDNRVEVQITMSLKTESHRGNFLIFGTKVVVEGGTSQNYSVRNLFEQAVPEEFWNDASTSYALSVSTEKDEIVSASLVHSDHDKMSFLIAEPFRFFDLAFSSMEHVIYGAGEIELNATIQNRGYQPSPDGIRLFFDNYGFNSIESVVLPAIQPNEQIKVTKTLESRASDGFYSQIDANDYNAFNNEYRSEFLYRVQIQEDDQIQNNTLSELSWLRPYEGIIFADQDEYVIQYTTSTPQSGVEEFRIYPQKVEIESSYYEQDLIISRDRQPCPEKLEIDFDTQELTVRDLEPGQSYTIYATLSDVPEYESGTTVISLHKSRYTKQEYLSSSSDSGVGRHTIVSPYYFRHIESDLDNRAKRMDQAVSRALDLDLARSFTIEIPGGVHESISITNRPKRDATIRVVGEGKTKSILRSITLEGFSAVEISDIAVIGRKWNGHADLLTMEEVSGTPNPDTDRYPYEGEPGIQIKRSENIHLHDLDIRMKGVGIDLQDNHSERHPPIGTLVENVTIAYGFQGISLRNQDGFLANGDGNRIFHMSTQGILINNGSQNCMFQGIQIEGSRHRGFNVEHAKNIAIENSQIRDSGYSGIHLSGDVDTILVRNNVIDGVNRDIANPYGDSDEELHGGIFAYRPIYDGIKLVQGFAGRSRDILILDNEVRNVGDGISLVQGHVNGVLIDGNEVSARRRGCRLEYGWTHTMTGPAGKSFWADLENVFLTSSNEFSLDNDLANIHATGYEPFFPCSNATCSDCGIELLPRMGADLYRTIALYPFPFSFYSANACQNECNPACFQWLDNVGASNANPVFLPIADERSYIDPNAKALSIDQAPEFTILELKQRVLNAVAHLSSKKMAYVAPSSEKD